MNEIQKPKLITPVMSAISAALMLMVLSLTVGNSVKDSGLRLIMIVLCSSGIIVSLSQGFIYLKQYVDYKFQEMERNNQKCQRASSLNENVSDA